MSRSHEVIEKNPALPFFVKSADKKLVDTLTGGKLIQPYVVAINDSNGGRIGNIGVISELPAMSLNIARELIKTLSERDKKNGKDKQKYSLVPINLNNSSLNRCYIELSGGKIIEQSW